jgi:3'-5' exoribonuclease-like protein
MPRYFLDTEFVDNGSTIDLISIGIVCEDGRELYLQSCEFSLRGANDWVKENVFPWLHICLHTPGGHELSWQMQQHRFANKGQCTFKDPEKGIIRAHDDCLWRTRAQIRDEIKFFFNPSDGIELWGWCAGYDFVALCQLFGTMMDLPQGWSHYICDFQYVLDGRHIPDDQLPQQESGVHNALEDAKHLKKLWESVVINNTWQKG